MSDDWLIVIPADPSLRPPSDLAKRAAHLFESMVGRAESVGIVEESTIVFLDAGENFETVRCNACPLCSTDTSLNEPVYDWPQGFASGASKR